MKKEEDCKFNKKCICYWSENNKYGFIPNTSCDVHGKKTREILKKSVEQSTEKKPTKEEIMERENIMDKEIEQEKKQ